MSDVLPSFPSLLGRYATPPNEDVGRVHRCLKIPDDVNILAAVNELLSRLNFPAVWDDSGGGVSAEDTAALCAEMFDFYINGACGMIGSITAFAGTADPDYYLLCDGQEYEGLDYPKLYEFLDDEFKHGIGLFRVPDMRGRMPVGDDAPEGLGWLVPLIIGAAGGSPITVMLAEHLFGHSHTTPNHTHTATGQSNWAGEFYAKFVGAGNGQYSIPINIPGVADWVNGSGEDADPTITVQSGGAGTTGETGEGEPMETVSPYFVLRFYIRYR